VTHGSLAFGMGPLSVFRQHRERMALDNAHVDHLLVFPSDCRGSSRGGGVALRTNAAMTGFPAPRKRQRRRSVFGTTERSACEQLGRGFSVTDMKLFAWL